MKNLNLIFNLLLFPFIFFKTSFLFQKKYTRTTTHTLKYLFIIPLLTFLMTIQAVADLDSENDTCPDGEFLTIVNGLNTFLGSIGGSGQNSDDNDYYQVIIPSDGNITITWQTAQSGKQASLTVGEDCNGTQYYNGNDTNDTHTTETFSVEKDNPIFIRIFNGEGKDYTLTIDYDIDTSNIPDYNSPRFCYEYYYQQNSINLDEHNTPLIYDTVSTASPVNVYLYLKNIGDVNTSYINAENVVVDIIDINTTQAIYTANSTYATKPGRFYRDYIPDTELVVSDSYIQGIDIGDVATLEFFAVEYSITPQTTSLNFPINAKLEYDLAIPVEVNSTLTVPVHEIIYLDSNISACDTNDTGYSPAYSIFNVEHNELNKDGNIYDIPTQTVNRVDDFEVVSYKIDALHTKNPIQSIVGVEIIDALRHGDLEASCAAPDSVISPRISIFLTAFDTNITEAPFDKVAIQSAITNGTISDQILNPGGDNITDAAEFYNVAKESAAFRVTYNTLGDGELIQIEEGNNGLYKIANFPDLHQEYPKCKQPVKNPNNNNMTDETPVACSDRGGNSTPADIAICMECLYGYNTRYLCSRDNFAIRPESYRVSLSDQDQISPANQSHIKTNIDTNPINIVAGYQYALEINATGYLNDNNVLGYDREFDDINASDDQHISFEWQHFSNDAALCNDINDHNKTMKFYNGALDSNLSNYQVGEYALQIVDNLWTRYDYDTDLMEHQTNHPVYGDVSQYFLSGIDCVPDVTTVPEEGTVVTDDGSNITSVSGCDIKSDHIRYDGTTKYTDINTTIYPYQINVIGLTPYAGPNQSRDQSFVYINTPDANDTNMSYNINGTFYAAGYNDGQLSNFVDNCYANDLNTTLYLQYQHSITTDSEPYLSYDLVDINSSGDIINPRPSVALGEPTYRFAVPSTGPLMVEQNSTNFAKDMNGSITMDLGYNFKRDNNERMNPRLIEMNDFNITYRIPPAGIKAELKSDFEIYGNKDLNDSNVSFYYGRTKASKFFYEDIREDIVRTPITILIYCNPATVANTCSFYGINTSGLDEIDESNWYLASKHRANSDDGNVTIMIGSPLIEPLNTAATDQAVVIDDSTSYTNGNAGNVRVINTGIKSEVDVTRGTNINPPLTVPVELVVDGTLPYTNRWLIYNENDADSPPSPFYKVRFIGEASWTGEGQTGHVVDINSSYKKSQRLDW